MKVTATATTTTTAATTTATTTTTTMTPTTTVTKSRILTQTRKKVFCFSFWRRFFASASVRKKFFRSLSFFCEKG